MCWCISTATALAIRLIGCTGELLVAAKYDPAVNWATKVDMDKSSPNYGRPKVVAAVLHRAQWRRCQQHQLCPAALGTKDEQPAAFSPDTGLFYVPTNHVCMDYEPFRVSYTAGQPYVGATLIDVSGPGRQQHGQLHRLGCAEPARSSGRIPSSSRSGPARLATKGGVVFYGTLEGYLKAVDAKTGQGTVQVQDAFRNHRQRHDV